MSHPYPWSALETDSGRRLEFVKVWLWLATRVLSNVVMLPDVVVVPYSTWLSAGLFVCQETTTELVDIEPVEIAEADPATRDFGATKNTAAVRIAER